MIWVIPKLLTKWERWLTRSIGRLAGANRSSNVSKCSLRGGLLVIEFGLALKLDLLPDMIVLPEIADRGTKNIDEEWAQTKQLYYKLPCLALMLN